MFEKILYEKWHNIPLNIIHDLDESIAEAKGIETVLKANRSVLRIINKEYSKRTR